MNTLPKVIERKIFHYANQMAVAERKKKWKPVHKEFKATIFEYIEPYLVFGPDKSNWDWCGGEPCAFRPGPYKSMLECLIEEQYPSDLSEHSESAYESS